MTKFYIDDNNTLRFHGSLATDSLRQALEWTIEKWNVIAVHRDRGGLIHNFGWKTCALCVYTESRGSGYTCGACPIYQKNKVWFGCSKTPYDDFACDQTAHNARREAEFLRGFLSEVTK